jgi:L,D-peptidoglycan transpeptidase YkuD (ErfK/YbiS/YcfS/YnhG family)
MIDALDGVIALGWEEENDLIDFNQMKRLVFKFGESEKDIKDKLYERDIVLEFEKKVVYEN